MADLLREALKLAQSGVQVFPCDAQKRPINAHGFHDATTDPEIIRAWNWSQAALIGAAVPTGHFVLDVDPRSGGDETIAALKRAGLDFGLTRVHRTRSGGYHLIYKLPPDHWTSKLRGSLGSGIDVKGANRGYIIVPPSPGYRVDTATKPAMAPGWLLEELVRAASGSNGHTKFFQQFEIGTKYGLAAMEHELGRLLMTEEGGRNNALNRAAFSLSQLVAGGELQGEAAIERLRLAAERIGLDPVEIKETISSGWDAGVTQPRTADPLRATPPHNGAYGMPSGTANGWHGAAIPESSEDHFWLDWQNMDDSPPPFYLEPIVPRNAYVLVYGATESSKSIVLMALAAEGSHLGLKSSIYSLENPPHIDADRVKRLGPDPENFRVTNQPLDLNDPRQLAALVEREQEWQTDWLIIDTYSHAFYSRSEDGNAKAIEFARRVRYLMAQIGCSLLLVDHTGYQHSYEPRDASAKRQAVDVAVLMSKVGKWAPGQPSRWSMENAKSARFSNPFFLRGSIADVVPGRGLKLTWEPGHRPRWSDDISR